MTRGRSATRRTPSVALALALAVAALVLTTWRVFVFGRSPASGIEVIAGESLGWVRDDLGPLGVTGDLDEAEVIVVGDSRVAHGVHLTITGSLGIGDVALVWLSSATLESLLEPLLALEPPRAHRPPPSSAVEPARPAASGGVIRPARTSEQTKGAQHRAQGCVVAARSARKS